MTVGVSPCHTFPNPLTRPYHSMSFGETNSNFPSSRRKFDSFRDVTRLRHHHNRSVLCSLLLLSGMATPANNPALLSTSYLSLRL
jgi:hypothetical protein